MLRCMIRMRFTRPTKTTRGGRLGPFTLTTHQLVPLQKVFHRGVEAFRIPYKEEMTVALPIFDSKSGEVVLPKLVHGIFGRSYLNGRYIVDLICSIRMRKTVRCNRGDPHVLRGRYGNFLKHSFLLLP